MDAMIARGPDDRGLYEDSQVALGHRRLSILDLSSAGRQPMSRADGKLWIVYNGEIYNYRELRRELEGRGHHFLSRTDTEVILALYEETGADCVSLLRGMFAFAVWDRRTQDPVLFLARDHFGIKPLVYASVSEGFVFASDLPGLLASGRLETDVDRVALVQYLMHGHVVQPRTILDGVRMLPAGHAMTVRPGSRVALWRYWDLDYEHCASLSAGMDPASQTERLRELLLDSARMQMESDVPLGAFLSGGIDSCSLVALMMKASGRPVHTYSIGFAGSGADLDETTDAQRSAEYLGAVHSNVPVNGLDVADALPDIAVRLGQPTVDGVNMYFVSLAARHGVTVALAGLGGDEIFAGYLWFSDLVRSWKVTGGARRPLGPALGRTGFWKVLPRSMLRESWELRSLRKDLASHYTICHMIRPPSEALRLAGGPDIDAGEMFAYLREDDPRVADLVSRVSRLDTKLYMCSQLLRDADAASMAHSLEVRVPFLDVEVAEFAFGLPGASKLGPLKGDRMPSGKRVLIEAVRDLIPEWTYRKPKRGFSMPFAEWLRGPLRPLAEATLVDATFRSAGLLDVREMDRIWKGFKTGGRVHWTRVWSLLMLVLWWRGLREHASMAARGSRARLPSRPAEGSVARIAGG